MKRLFIFTTAAALATITSFSRAADGTNVPDFQRIIEEQYFAQWRDTR